MKPWDVLDVILLDPRWGYRGPFYRPTDMAFSAQEMFRKSRCRIQYEGGVHFKPAGFMSTNIWIEFTSHTWIKVKDDGTFTFDNLQFSISDLDLGTRIGFSGPMIKWDDLVGHEVYYGGNPSPEVDAT